MRNTRVIVTHYAGPNALQAVEEECPEPNACEMRVSVAGRSKSARERWYATTNSVFAPRLKSRKAEFGNEFLDASFLTNTTQFGVHLHVNNPTVALIKSTL